MIQVILGLGSNTSYKGTPPAVLLGSACAQLKKVLLSCVFSSVYRTKAMYVTGQNDFYNMCVRGFAEESVTPHSLLDTVHHIEALYGRDRDHELRFGPRPLDIDIELFGEMMVNDSALQIPHPRMHERAFVLIPLLEILSDSADADMRNIYTAYLKRLPDQGVQMYLPAKDFCIPCEV
ncbi:MAG: 2-amino-4-hydroxy-6-hydroxymethyldihydropteridine diphosphokinase [Treponema sp.]